jgi:hypothetical protein
MDWKPKPRIFTEMAESEPTKPSEPGFDGFEGGIPAKSSKIEAEPSQEEIDAAGEVLKRAGVRLMELPAGTAVGIWSDLDSAEVRAALRVFGSDVLPVWYLDARSIQARFKLRRAEGEPVSLDVLREMERHPDEPWKIRDRLLSELGWCSTGPPGIKRNR